MSLVLHVFAHISNIRSDTGHIVILIVKISKGITKAAILNLLGNFVAIQLQYINLMVAPKEKSEDCQSVYLLGTMNVLYAQDKTNFSRWRKLLQYTDATII